MTAFQTLRDQSRPALMSSRGGARVSTALVIVENPAGKLENRKRPAGISMPVGRI